MRILKSQAENAIRTYIFETYLFVFWGIVSRLSVTFTQYFVNLKYLNYGKIVIVHKYAQKSAPHCILCAIFTITLAKALKCADGNYGFKISNAEQMADITQPTASASSENDTVTLTGIRFELPLHPLRRYSFCRQCDLCTGLPQ